MEKLNIGEEVIKNREESFNMMAFKLSNKVQYRQEGDKGLLFMVSDEGDVKSVFLNETGKIIIEFCDGEHSIDDIAKKICEEFESCLEEVINDVEEFVFNLKKEGWICNA